MGLGTRNARSHVGVLPLLCWCHMSVSVHYPLCPRSGRFGSCLTRACASSPSATTRGMCGGGSDGQRGAARRLLLAAAAAAAAAAAGARRWCQPFIVIF